MQWFWNWLAERAHRRSIASATSAERDIERAGWWADVQAWADGLGSWRDIRDRRRLSTGKG